MQMHHGTEASITVHHSTVAVKHLMAAMCVLSVLVLIMWPSANDMQEWQVWTSLVSIHNYALLNEYYREMWLSICFPCEQHCWEWSLALPHPTPPARCSRQLWGSCVPGVSGLPFIILIWRWSVLFTLLTNFTKYAKSSAASFPNSGVQSHRYVASIAPLQAPQRQYTYSRCTSPCYMRSCRLLSLCSAESSKKQCNV